MLPLLNIRFAQVGMCQNIHWFESNNKILPYSAAKEG